MANATSDAAVAMKQFRCPNGLLVWNAPESGGDTRFIYTEIFEHNCYEQHGITIADRDVIVDVGANVGLFAMSVMERFRNLRIFCLEPVANIRACLSRNLAESPWRTLHDVTVLAYASGAANGEATISYFPQTPANSTLHMADKRREWADIVGEITPAELWRHNRVLAVLLPFVFPLRRMVFNRYVAPVLDNAVSMRCEVRTLSETIRQQALERIDLLKIDVEGAELEVLDGIEEQHWPRIRQLVVEIAAKHKAALPALRARLHARGFHHIAVTGMTGETAAADSPLPSTLYAVRPASYRHEECST